MFATLSASACFAVPQAAAMSTAAAASTHSPRAMVKARSVRASDACSAFGAVEASALCGAHRLVAKVDIANARVADSDKQFLRDGECA